MAAASGKKLIQTVIHNTNTASHMQSITARMVLGGTAMAAGAAYHIAELRKEVQETRKEVQETRKEVESAHRKAESAQKEADKAQKEAENAQKEAEKAQHRLDIQIKETECLRREMEIRSECDAKLEAAKSSWWSSWFG